MDASFAQASILTSSSKNLVQLIYLQNRIARQIHLNCECTTCFRSVCVCVWEAVKVCVKPQESSYVLFVWSGCWRGKGGVAFQIYVSCAAKQRDKERKWDWKDIESKLSPKDIFNFLIPSTLWEIHIIVFDLSRFWPCPQWHQRLCESRNRISRFPVDKELSFSCLPSNMRSGQQI